MNNQRCIMIPLSQYNQMVKSYDEAVKEIEKLKETIESLNK